MLLSEFQVTNYRNILDSTPIEVEDDVTCLVGKNAAGKSALLQALYRLNPAHPASFDLKEHYPLWLLTHDRRHGKIEEVRPIQATSPDTA
jgi:recombinational DNA repair ATPase RecF